jgi:hypothetical protein
MITLIFFLAGEMPLAINPNIFYIPTRLRMFHNNTNYCQGLPLYDFVIWKPMYQPLGNFVLEIAKVLTSIWLFTSGSMQGFCFGANIAI